MKTEPLLRDLPEGLALVRLGPEDAPALAALEAACFPDPWSREAFAAAFGREAFLAYGLRRGDALAAYITLYVTGEELEILNIAVREDARKRGWGGILLGHVLQLADKAGIKRGFLEVRAGNEPARRLYARQGFTAAGVRKRYYPDTGEDALILVRDADEGRAFDGE